MRLSTLHSRRHAALKGQQNQIRATPDAKLAEQVRDVEFYGALGDVEFAGDFFVGEVFQQRVQDFLLAAAQIGD